MNTKETTWKPLSITFSPELHDALQQQHHAAQFIAMVGRHLIPQQTDDSNTNMQFVPVEDLLLGNPLPNELHVALRLNDLTMLILDRNKKVKKEITLEGKTKQQVFDELKQGLSLLGTDVTNLKQELHYEIPTHPLDKGAVFTVSDKKYFIENASYRHNARLVLNDVSQLFEHKEPIRVWPHHFDTGAFFVITKNEKGESAQTFGIGFAIPDSMVDEPYYYLSFWSEKPVEKLKKLPPLPAGQWMLPNWNGAILKLSDILKAGTAKAQHEVVSKFFHYGVEIIMDRF